MSKLTVYDPAMCCSTGICGTDIDQRLVDFASDLDWLEKQGVEVTRFNLSQEPAEFAANDAVRNVLEQTGVEGLPVIIVNSEVQSSGTYPSRSELAQLAGLGAELVNAAEVKSDSGSGCCGSSQESVRKVAGDTCCSSTQSADKSSGGCC